MSNEGLTPNPEEVLQSEEKNESGSVIPNSVESYKSMIREGEHKHSFVEQLSSLTSAAEELSASCKLLTENHDFLSHQAGTGDDSDFRYEGTLEYISEVKVRAEELREVLRTTDF